MAQPKKQALGRGLGALLQSMETTNPNSQLSNTITAGLSFISIDLIETNPHQPRQEFEQTALEELSQSIAIHGVITPITVTKIGDKYQLIAGERRLRASKLAGLKEIPAYIKVATESQIMEMALVENIQREDLNAIEIALSFQALIEECKLTQEEMSEKVGKSRPTITNYLRLLKLPSQVQIAIRDQSLTMGHARAIINIESQEEQIEIMNKIIQNDLSVRQVESMVSQLNKPKKLVEKKVKGSLPTIHENAKKELSKKLSSQIQITRSQRGKGVISIAFSNDKDFERIVEMLQK